ncbi:cystathionine beta-lyase [Inquilinus sp.]|jgi:cystathionine beta-lyase|uniref:cystathionine beta-lyase n=1 Tax=Inquilinus sp. TaxID=1932117 RepID=UPI0037851383
MSKSRRPATVLAHAGRHPRENHGMVNPPVYHSSTVLWPTVAAMDASHAGFEHGVYSYGRVGTPTSEAFEDAVTALEGGYGTVAVSSGLAAVNVALTAFVKAGDHVLVTDSAYGPTRRYADSVLSRFGVEVEYYDPLAGAGIEALFRGNTRLVYLESPGSLTFEVQDVPAIAAAARSRGVLTALDNTWATPLGFDAFGHGVDVTVHAATKYMVGHSDAMMGIVGAREKSVWLKLKSFAVTSGHCAGPDDLYLAQRGLRTMGVRLRQHQENALEIARWLQARPEVSRVLYPALPQDPGHALWRRDFTGASGLFAIVLQPASAPQVAAMLDGMELFQMGASWGGYESLILPTHPEKIRTATRWDAEGPGVRLHVGLEDPADLIADLEAGFDRLRAAA